MTIKQVSDYFMKEYGVIIFVSDLFQAKVIHNMAILLDIAQRTRDRNIQRAQHESTCHLCNHFTICNSEGDAKCVIINHLRDGHEKCSCHQRCVSKYIERIQKEFKELEYTYQYNTSEFLRKVVCNQDEQTMQEFDALVIEDIGALHNYLHRYIVERAEKFAQYDIETAKQEYKKALSKAQKRVEKAIAMETQFWSNLK